MSMNKLIKNHTAVKCCIEKKIDERQNTLLNQSTEMKHYKQEPESERNLLKNFTQQLEKRLNDFNDQYGTITLEPKLDERLQTTARK